MKTLVDIEKHIQKERNSDFSLSECYATGDGYVATGWEGKKHKVCVEINKYGKINVRSTESK